MGMFESKRRWLVGAVVGVIGLVGVGTGAVTASLADRGAPPKGATIAIVDLEKLINGLDEKRAKGEQFQGAFDAKKTELEALKKKIEERETAVKNMAPGAARTKGAEELRDMIIRAEMEAQLANRKLDLQQADLFLELYEKVNEAIATLSKQNGYHLVFVSDESAKVPKGNSETVLRGITMKRMLYVDDALDITDEVVRFMNNSFAAAGGKAPPAAPAKPVANANKGS